MRKKTNSKDNNDGSDNPEGRENPKVLLIIINFNGINFIGESIDYFGILNNDLRLDAQWLENLINYGEKKPECGILAGKMLIYYWPKYINSTGGIVNYFGSGWDRDFLEVDE